MKKMTPRERIIVGMGLALGLVWVLNKFMVQPLYKKQVRTDQEIESKILFISQYYSILSQKDYYLKKEESTRLLTEELDQRFIPQEKPALAGADLQRILQDLAKSNSVHIVQVNTEKPKNTVGLLTVPVRIVVRSSLRNLSGYLHGIENHKLFLVVEDLQTRRINRNEPEYLESRLLVNGFLKQLIPENQKRT